MRAEPRCESPEFGRPVRSDVVRRRDSSRYPRRRTIGVETPILPLPASIDLHDFADARTGQRRLEHVGMILPASGTGLLVCFVLRHLCPSIHDARGRTGSEELHKLREFRA